MAVGQQNSTAQRNWAKMRIVMFHRLCFSDKSKERTKEQYTAQKQY